MNLLVVVDMVEGFVNFGALADKKIDKITPNITNLIKHINKENTKVIVFRDSHNVNDEEFKTFPVHCLKGSLESQFIPQIKALENQIDLDIEKNTTNGFITKKFQKLIKNCTFDNVIVTGCCTDICVLNFVTSYINFIKRNHLKTRIIVVEDACYTFDGKNHNAQEFHNKAIKKMKEMGAIIKVMDNKNVEKIKSKDCFEN